MNPEKKDNSEQYPISSSGETAPPPPVGFGELVIPEAAHPSTTDTASLPNALPADESHAHHAHHKNVQSDNSWYSVVSTILLFLLAPILALTITAFAFQSYQVDGESMETALQNNDRLIVNKTPRTIARITHHAYIPHRGDIVIFNQAGLFDSVSGEKQLIKRVIGLPSERIIVKDGFITVYNKQGRINPDNEGLYKITAPTTSGDVDVTLGPNEIFVCGDNRPNSEDSRAFGPVNVNNIVGKLVLRVLPMGKAQSF
jgi:signal peptidase I